jgi:hypothetical protein
VFGDAKRIAENAMILSFSYLDLNMVGYVLVEHDVEAQAKGQDEEGVPGQEEDEAPHHLVEHRHVDVVAETECLGLKA